MFRASQLLEALNGMGDVMICDERLIKVRAHTDEPEWTYDV